ncbi:succinylglutamate desuccinylase/aspartoacylase family protein [Chitinivorax sp. B]|uniref:succinylglutamate desuccinylase/aspartoacylase family protein n=1 Tax=Chitinivorax sp. B TaxID=2502235 RepID=UPI0010F6D4A4|nr:succinylglutamate desuccinylase/aspartoacylase family protein [Chitinivorax sp. B]
MNIQHHLLISPSIGTQRSLRSLHYGASGMGEKIYLQASLHADELPGMLVLHHLRPLLDRAEAAGKIKGEIVLVPYANPIGLSQSLLHDQMGRFEFTTGENFNRYYTDFAPLIQAKLAEAFTQDAKHNTSVIRAAMREVLAQAKPLTELESLRHTLMSLAFDADVVLDLHCDTEAVLHLYTGTPLWAQCEPLARYLGAHATLLATESGGQPFDEACAQTWWKLADYFRDRFPIEMACLSVTVELRGEQDVTHELAAQDAASLYAFLCHRGVVDEPAPALPPLLHAASPLAGSDSLTAPIAGAVAFHKQVGDVVAKGDAVFDVIDPLLDRIATVTSNTAGVLYARENRRYATAGMCMAKVAGSVPFKTGNLLSA